MHRITLIAVLTFGCGSTPEPTTPYDHCKPGAMAEADPRDATLSAPLQAVRVGSNQDVALPDVMLDWLDEQGWPQQHDDWHNVRRWDQGCRKSNATADDCANARRLADRGLARAPKQENAPGDGYDFLLMHRHMLEGMRAAFPKNRELVRGWGRVPRNQADPENVAPWRAISWTASQLEAIEVLENVEQHVDRFPTEDDLSRYMQAPFVWTETNPTQAVSGSGGLHFALHSQWSVPGSPVELGNGRGVVYNASFWRLHGWLDDVWERYRRARGLTADADYRAALEAQCREMVDLDERRLTPAAGSPDAGAPGETGVFALQVRPALERACGTCHGTTAPTLGLTLGGATTSRDIVAGLVNVRSSQVELPLVAPGSPERSWLYLKAAGTFDGVVCDSCKTVMPPAGERLSATELERLRSWIAAGASAP
ncbi:MAG: hypothetical protein SFW67_08225 [Myxococcaceae bacterium]|nr:hypothetical protein [Myxococcaceae bacterium]